MLDWFMVSVNPVSAVAANPTVSVKVPKLETVIWSVAALVPVAALGMYRGWVTVVSLKSPTLREKPNTEPRYVVPAVGVVDVSLELTTKTV